MHWQKMWLQLWLGLRRRRRDTYQLCFLPSLPVLFHQQIADRLHKVLKEESHKVTLASLNSKVRLCYLPYRIKLVIVCSFYMWNEKTHSINKWIKLTSFMCIPRFMYPTFLFLYELCCCQKTMKKLISESHCCTGWHAWADTTLETALQ